MNDTWVDDWTLDYVKSANTVMEAAYAQLNMVYGTFSTLNEYGELVGRIADAEDRLRNALPLLDDACHLLGSFLEDTKETNGQRAN